MKARFQPCWSDISLRAAPPVQSKGGIAYFSQDLDVSLFVLVSLEQTNQNLPLPVSKLPTSMTCEKFKA